jgi:enoyl-CoA hydratase/carnithine racemase
MSAEEAYSHGIISRIVPQSALDDTAWEMASKVAAAPLLTVTMARRVLQHLSEPGVRASMADEMVYQSYINKSADFAEFKAARADGRDPDYSGN